MMYTSIFDNFNVSFFTDEGVYVNNSGSLVKHAVMQWGETPYAVGKITDISFICGVSELIFRKKHLYTENS